MPRLSTERDQIQQRRNTARKRNGRDQRDTNEPTEPRQKKERATRGGFGTSARGIGGKPAGHPGHGVRAPAEFRAEAIRPNSPRGELDTS